MKDVVCFSWESEPWFNGHFDPPGEKFMNIVTLRSILSGGRIDPSLWDNFTSMIRGKVTYFASCFKKQVCGGVSKVLIHFVLTFLHTLDAPCTKVGFFCKITRLSR